MYAILLLYTILFAYTINFCHGVSSDNTTVPPARWIIDKSGNVWILSGGDIYVNNNKLNSTYAQNVSLILWYGSMVYNKGYDGQFHVYTWTGEWFNCTDPRTLLAANPGSFYGINGHWDYPFTPAFIVGALKTLGINTYRVNTENSSRTLDPIIALAKEFRPAGIKIFPVIDVGLQDANHQVYPDEQSAYNIGKGVAAGVATALEPYGITDYEVGNELTRNPAIIVNYDRAGNKPEDFNNTNWPILRGFLRGMIDGIKSVQPNARCGVNFCVADVAASDMLWEGTQPDGTSGYPPIRWDITTWHNYSPYGDIFDVGTDARYGAPFMITEWNSDPSFKEANRAKYVANQLGEFYNARKTQAFESSMLYELTGGDGPGLNFGILNVVNGTIDPIQPTYGAYQTFAQQHTDN